MTIKKDKLEEWEKPPKCIKCGKEMEMVYDKIAKKISKYLWKPTCNCLPKDIRLAIL